MHAESESSRPPPGCDRRAARPPPLYQPPPPPYQPHPPPYQPPEPSYHRPPPHPHSPHPQPPQPQPPRCSSLAARSASSPGPRQVHIRSSLDPRLHQLHSTTYTPIDPVLNVEVFNTMAGSQMSTPLVYDEQLSAGSPAQRTPVVQVIMPQSINSRTSNRTRDSTVGSRIDRTRRARCMVGSPSLRIINRIQMSPRFRSPRSTTTQNSTGSRAGRTSRQLRSVYWKEFEPVTVNGEIVKAKCIHCPTTEQEIQQLLMKP